MNCAHVIYQNRRLKKKDWNRSFQKNQHYQNRKHKSQTFLFHFFLPSSLSKVALESNFTSAHWIWILLCEPEYHECWRSHFNYVLAEQKRHPQLGKGNCRNFPERTKQIQSPAVAKKLQTFTFQMSLSLHDSVANCSAAFGMSTEAGRVSPPEPNLATAGLSKVWGKQSLWRCARASSTAFTWPSKASPPSDAAKVSAALELKPLNSQKTEMCQF